MEKPACLIKVLLMQLYKKTLAKRNVYYGGRIGAASVVMMRDLYADSGDPVWQVFVSEPRQAAAEGSPAAWPPIPGQPPAKPPEARKSAPRGKLAMVTPSELNDDISDMGRS